VSIYQDTHESAEKSRTQRAEQSNLALKEQKMDTFSAPNCIIGAVERPEISNLGLKRTFLDFWHVICI